MYSRARKLPHCNSDLQALHKQLNNDFEVQQYLLQHQIQHNNTNQYASLLNSLVLDRRQKLVKLNRMKVDQPERRVDETSREKFQFRELEEKTGKEFQIKKNLEREIVQIKKSLNLLKGDIGHLVLRNQSSQLLGSKVNKARIVAEDQLKRVTLALAKDREEIKLRNDMQKKFNKKLKNVESYENSGLGKAKNHYIEGQIRKDEAYKKLLSSQMTAQNGQEMAKILTIKQKVDANSLIMQQDILELGEVASHFSQQNRDFPQDIATLSEQIDQFIEHLNISNQFSSQAIQKAVRIILQQFHNNREELRAMSQFYESQLKNKQQLKNKLVQYEQEQNSLAEKIQLQILQNYQVSQQQLCSFNIRVKKLSSLIKTQFAILTYIEKYMRNNSDHHHRRQSICMPLTSCCYVSQLHTLYQLLISSQEPSNIDINPFICVEEIDNFYELMLNKIKEWGVEVTTRYEKAKKGEITVRKPYIKPTTFQRTTQFLEPIPSNSLHQDSSSSIHQTPESQFNKVNQTGKMAKRIKLLEDVDINYYKMIKNTMKMEKQNTRKNYQFLRTWKRAKYASRDQILEEKRFESSFSVLFTSSNLSVPLKNMKTNESSQKDSRVLSKLFRSQQRQSKTMHGSTLSTLKPKGQSKPSTPVVGLKKVRSSMLEDKDKKSRLTQKLKMALDYS